VRKYFSRQRTYAAQRMVITGKLPPPAQVQPVPAGRSLRETGPLAAPGTKSVYPLARTAVNTDPTLNVPIHLRYTPSNTGDRWEAIQPARPLNAVAAYTQPPVSTGTLQNSESIPSESEALFFEGGISAGQETNRPPAALRVVESTLVPLPPDTPRSPSGSLWSYSTRLPALRAKRRDGQFITSHPGHTVKQILARSPVASAKEPERPARTYPSSSLWSYTDRHAAVKKGH